MVPRGKRAMSKAHGVEPHPKGYMTLVIPWPQSGEEEMFPGEWTGVKRLSFFEAGEVIY